MVLPHFITLFRWVTTYAWALMKSRVEPQHLVVHDSQNTRSCATHLRSTSYADGSDTGCRVLFRRRSAAYPPILDRKSAAFYTRENARFPQKIRLFPAGFARLFVAFFINDRADDFISFFVLDSGASSGRSRREKWRKTGGSERVAENVAFGPAGPLPVGAHVAVHTECGTWNISLECGGGGPAAGAAPQAPHSKIAGCAPRHTAVSVLPLRSTNRSRRLTRT
jgi:hypothetical protein